MFPRKIIPIQPILRALALLGLSLFWGTSCGKAVETVRYSDRTIEPGRRLLVLPFQDVAATYGKDVSILCHLCGKMATTGEVEPGAAQFLTESLNELLDDIEGYQEIPASQARGVISHLLGQSQREIAELDLYVKTGRELDADLILAGYVYRFRERDGTDYSVAQPASVAFHLDMVDVKSGQVVWSGHFDETQPSLSEDLFQLGNFIRRKGKWITAEQLAVYGLKQVLKSMPQP